MTTDKINVQDKDIVIPGDLLATGMEFLPSGQAFREEDKIFASTLGLASVRGRIIKVIPLSGRYMPKRGDSVIGTITGIGHSGWQANIDCPYNADLNIGEATIGYIDSRADLTKIYDIGDYFFGVILGVSDSKYVKLSTKDRQYKKLRGGNIIKVQPTKIPRIIGKQGSMIGMVKDYTKCEIIVGQNGFIWIKGEDSKLVGLATKAIRKIEDESHTSGLTDKIKAMLEKEAKK